MNHARGAYMTAETRFEPSNVNVRIKISALWTSMLFVFAYVDLFSLYRPDVRADLDAGEVGGFTVNQSFLVATTVYVVIPSLMVFCALVLRPRIDRIVNIASHRVCAHDHRWRDRRVELLHPRQRRRGRTARGDRLLRLDLAERRSTNLHDRTRGDSSRHPTDRSITKSRAVATPNRPIRSLQARCQYF
jgi:hypothetical protein